MADPFSSPPASELRLDDLYLMTAHMFGGQNAGRERATTFAHFVEVCGMLSGLDRSKARGEVDVEDALCKALGWYFPLMAQFGVASLEDLLFRKYPGICPYCRRKPHQDRICKTVRGEMPGIVDHAALRELAARNPKPASLDAWQWMFQEIYPRTTEDRPGRSTLGLLEELGELAEAIRVFDQYPKYFAGEAADVFSYVMGLANEYSLRVEQKEDRTFSLEDEYLVRYPGMCIACGHRICQCPYIPSATVGRMAKEMDVDPHIFRTGSVVDASLAERTSETVLKRVGGVEGVISRFPLDRGEANAAIVQQASALADALRGRDADLADSFRRIAFKLARSRTKAGDHGHSPEAKEAVLLFRQLLSESSLAREAAATVIEPGDLTMVAVPSKRHIVVVASCPDDAGRIRPDREVRIIQDCIDRSKFRDRFEVTPVVAAQFDHLRTVLLENDEVSLIHFAGHGTGAGLRFEDGHGGTTEVQLADLADYLDRMDSLECVVLNACYSLTDISGRPLGKVTVGMEQAVDDEAAQEFARGFYDALGAGKSPAFAVEEGLHTARAKGYGELEVRTVVAQPSAGHGSGVRA